MSSPQTQQPSDEERRKQQAEAEAVKAKGIGDVIGFRGKAETC